VISPAERLDTILIELAKYATLAGHGGRARWSLLDLRMGRARASRQDEDRQGAHARIVRACSIDTKTATRLHARRRNDWRRVAFDAAWGFSIAHERVNIHARLRGSRSGIAMGAP